MSRHSWRRRALATGTAVGIGWLGSLSVAACSGDPDQPAASVTPAASTPSVPGDGTEPVRGPSAGASEPREPVLPAAAWGDSVRSAKAFVEYYIDLLNYAMVSGDTEAFRAASMPGCGGCADYVDFVNGIYADGGYYQTGGWNDLRVVLSGRDSGLLFAITATAPPVRYKLSRSAKARTTDGERFTFSVVLEEVKGQWSTSDIFSS